MEINATFSIQVPLQIEWTGNRVEIRTEGNRVVWSGELWKFFYLLGITREDCERHFKAAEKCLKQNGCLPL